MGGMAEVPEGLVTIMFTDLEGSTTLRTTLGDTAADALFTRHDGIIRDRIAAHNGHDQSAALGDGFLAVFTSTRRAVACAIEIQNELDAFNRMNPGPRLKVRIGLNTGEVTSHDGQLTGEAVHAAARVCGAASGGQVLVSDVTRQLAGTVADVTFRDAGEFDLKGFPIPWRLWEVVWVRETGVAAARVFVGRESELAMLRNKLHAALDGRGGLVLVGGEPGVGKTTLVRQLIQEAERCGALAVFGRCYESEGAVPYAPFVEMLEQALALMPGDIVREDMGEDAPEVARMVPELRRRFPDISEPLELPPEQQRRYFFSAVGSFVSRGSLRFPLLLVMDDVHWADEPTLLLTEHLAALMPGLRVLGVGTYRDVELGVSRPLAGSIERLLRNRLVDRLPVRRFDRDTVATMIEAMAGMDPPSVVIDAIFSETEGNPFFVEEVYRHLVEDGGLFDETGAFRTDIEVDELDVPESVRLVVGRRLERLGADAQRILAAGAVVGRGFPFRLLEDIVDTDGATLLDIVDAAESARVIVAEERDGEVHYSFGHELIRQTLLSGLSVVRRQRLHLSVADAIERTDSRAREDRPSEIAGHLLQAGAAADRKRTLEFLELAADRAFAAAAFEEALRAVDNAIVITGPDDAVRLAQLHERRGWAVRALGHFDECIAIWDRVIDVYVEHGLTDEAAELCLESGYQRVWLSRFEEAFFTYARGLSIVGDEPTGLRSSLLALNGGMLGLAGFYDLGAQQSAEAEAIARSVGDERALGRVLWARTMSQWSNMRTQESRESGRAAIEHLRRTNDQWALVDALAWTSYPLVLSGDAELMEEGRRFAGEAVELGRRLGHRGGEVLGTRGAIMGRVLNADAEALELAAREDLEGFASVASPWISQSHVLVAIALVMRGDLEAALDHAEQARELEPQSAWSGLAWSSELFVRAWRGEVEICRRLLDEHSPAFPPEGTRGSAGAFFSMLLVTQAAWVAGLRADAAAMYPLLSPWLDEFPVSGFDASLPERVLAMAAAAGERWDDAERLFETALRRATELPNRIDHAQTRHWYGEMLLDRAGPGDAERARELLQEALVSYGELGMPLFAERARRVLAAAER